jgi:hypothetical protein
MDLTIFTTEDSEDTEVIKLDNHKKLFRSSVSRDPKNFRFNFAAFLCALCALCGYRRSGVS